MVPRSNKLTVYLIKEEYTKFGDILASQNSSRVEFDEYSVLYYQPSIMRTPDWVESFFGKQIGDTHKRQMKVAGIQSVLLVKTSVQPTRIFALTFGQGRFMLRDGVTEERFGLKSVLNQITDKEIQNMEKRAFSRIPKLIREQLPKIGDISDFELDIERDLIESITGRPAAPAYGRTLTGKDSYSLTGKVDYTNLRKFLEHTLKVYSGVKYKDHFKWFDQIKTVKDPVEVDALDSLMIQKINQNSADVWLGVPQLVDWESHTGYKYSSNKKEEQFDSLDIAAWKEYWTDGGSVRLNDLRESHITLWNGEELQTQWSTYRCIYAELNHKGSAYFLTDGKWYCIEKKFVDEVNRYIKNNILWETPALKPFDATYTNENEYNKYLANYLDGVCLDAKNIPYGGGSSKVEFCDVLVNRQLYFVKKYSSSATLSHWFMQALVSGELLASDQEFRKRVRDQIQPTSKKAWVPEVRLNPNDFEIVFFLIKRKKGNSVQLPFFSKVSLRRVHQRLSGYRYRIKFSVVDNKRP